MTYTGYKCIVCGKEFEDDDDIVVCVECGTPYHRDCYKKDGCINEELHSTHISWKQANERNEAPAPVCANCGNKLRQGQAYCDACGTPTAARSSPTPVYRPVGTAGMGSQTSFAQGDLLDVDPCEEVSEGVTLGDLSMYVGSSTMYYVPRFSLMHKFGMRIGLNFGAMFFPELYFAYRKMPLIALMLFALRMLVDIPSVLLLISTPEYAALFTEGFAQFPQLIEIIERIAAMGLDKSSSFMTLCTVTSGIDTAICIAMGFYANYMYYRYSIRAVTTLNKTGNSAFIPMAGGTSVSLVIIFVLLMSVKMIASIFIANAIL